MFKNVVLLTGAMIGFSTNHAIATRMANLARLHHDLFKNYDKMIIPLVEEETPVEVDVGLAVHHMALDEIDLKMLCQGRLSWTDPRLQWNEKKYDNISVIRIPADQVWIPDIRVHNSIEYGPGSWASALGDNTIQAIISSNGSVNYIPMLQVDVRCINAETQPDPWSEYACRVKLASWTFDGNTLDVNKFSNRDSIDVTNLDHKSPVFITENSFEKDAKKVTVYQCCDEPYPSILYEFRVQRRVFVTANGTEWNGNMTKAFTLA